MMIIVKHLKQENCSRWLNFKELLATVGGVKRVTRWWLWRGILEQSQLANKLIE
jgi:hypothetical protein